GDGRGPDVVDVDVDALQAADGDLVPLEHAFAADGGVLAELDRIHLAVAEARAQVEVAEQGRDERAGRGGGHDLGELDGVAEEEGPGPAVAGGDLADGVAARGQLHLLHDREIERAVDDPHAVGRVGVLRQLADDRLEVYERDVGPAARAALGHQAEAV